MHSLAVDRILKQHEVQREATTDAFAKERVDKTVLLSSPPVLSEPTSEKTSIITLK